MAGRDGGKDGWDKIAIVISALGTVLLPLSVFVVGLVVSDSLKEREVAVKESTLAKEWAQLALNVLSDEDFAQEREVRAWAVSVINHYVDDAIRLPDPVRASLVEGRLNLPKMRLSPSAEATAAIQDRLNARGRCGSLPADGIAGPATIACIQDFLGDASIDEVRALVSDYADLLSEWLESGRPPDDWRRVTAETTKPSGGGR